MCHSIPGYRHADEVAKKVAAKAALPALAVAGVLVVVNVLSVLAMLTVAGVVSLALAAVIVRRVVANYYAVLAWQDVVDKAAAQRLAIARERKLTESPGTIHVHAERPQAIEAPRDYPWSFPWPQEHAQAHPEPVERKQV